MTHKTKRVSLSRIYLDNQNPRHDPMLYKKFPTYTHLLNYTAQVKRVGSEILVLDPRLTPPWGIATEVQADGLAV